MKGSCLINTRWLLYLPIRALTKIPGRSISSAMLSLSLAVLLAGCQDGGKEFRQALRSAASSLGKHGAGANNSPNNGKGGPTAVAENAIKECPDGGKLTGAPFPKAESQWCEQLDKSGKTFKHGPIRRWHDNGITKFEGNFDQGQLHGVTRQWNREGVLIEEAYYVEGVKDGPSTVFNKDGSKNWEGKFKEGRKNGPFLFWGKGESPKEKGFYLDDEKSGVWISYSPTGRIKSKISWREGKKNGRAEFFNSTGFLIAQSYFRDNLPHGPWRTFYNAGQLKTEGSYIEGKKNGPWNEYAKNGALRKTQIFDQGEIVETRSQQNTGTSRASKYSSFGKGDILGGSPPIRRQKLRTPLPIGPIPNPLSPDGANSPEKEEDDDGWKPM